jgi:ribosome maturation factor RimP
MIEKGKIEQLTTAFIQDTDYYIVDIKVDSANNVTVMVDSNEGFDITKCVELSRHIEEAFDRDVEDFALEVSSPGIGQPFKVIQQYYKVLNKQVAVVLNDGRKVEGELAEVREQEILVKYQKKEKLEGQKRPKWVEKAETFTFEEIKSTIELI